MEIQSITGPDIVPQGPSVQSVAVVESVPSEEREAEVSRSEEENKGRNIDQYV